MLGGALGGLANLGQIYRGFQQSQDEDLSRQIKQQTLLDAQNTQLAGTAFQSYFRNLQTAPTQPLASPTPTPPLYSPGQIQAQSLPPLPGGGAGGGGAQQLAEAPKFGGAFDTQAAPQQPTQAPQLGEPGGGINLAGLGTQQPATTPTPTLGLQRELPLRNADMSGPTAGTETRALATQPVSPFRSPQTAQAPPGVDQPGGQWGGEPQQQPGTFRQSPAPTREPGTGEGARLPTVPPPLFNRMLQLESGGSMDTSTVGSYGEIGPSQITPDTWKQYSRPGENIRDPQTNLEVGQRIMQDLWSKSGGDQAAVLVGYNRGEGAMRRFQAAGDDLGALRGTSMMPTAAYQQAIAQAGGKGGGSPVAMMHASLNREVSAAGAHDAGIMGAQQILSTLPQMPQIISMAQTGSQVAKMIDQALPNATDTQKGAVFLKLFPVMSQIAKQDSAEQWERYNAQMGQRKEARTELHEQVTEAETRRWHDIEAGRAQREPLGGPVQTDTGAWVQPMRGGPAQPLPGKPVGAVTAETRVDADPRKSAFEAFKSDYAAAHGGKQPSAQEQADFMRSLYPSRSAPGMALQTFIQQFQQEHDGRMPSSDDIRQFQAETRAMASEAGAIGTAGANVDIQANKAEALIPLVKERSHAISRTNYPDINSLILAYETKTGSPETVQYGEVVNALRYTFASIMARGGQARVADIQHFDEIFNKAWSAGQVDAALDQIQTTINRERAAIIKTRKQVGTPTGQRDQPDETPPPSFKPPSEMSTEEIQRELGR